MHKDNPVRNVTRRMQREVRHDERALQEKSKTITGFEFVKDLEFYFYGKGGKEAPQSEFIVHFNLTYPVLLTDFEEKIREKLKGVLIS